MTSKSVTNQVLKPLATGLAQQDWTAQALQAHLQQRLPAGLTRTVPALAVDLLAAFPASVAPDAQRIAQYLKSAPVAAPVRAYAKRTGVHAAFPSDPPRFRPVSAMADCGLPALHTPHDLADWLALTPEDLTRFSDCRGLSARTPGPFGSHYRQYLQRKSDGQLRLLEDPKPLLKRLQRRILHDMLNLAPPHEAAFGFCLGKSAPMSAARHAGEAMVVCFDLSAFFPSVGQHRVYALFRRMGYAATVARHLTGLCTAITPREMLNTPDLAAANHLSNRHLPQGAPTSPALANLGAYGLDVRMAGLARRLDANYTRYADDLTFSGDRHIAQTLLNAVPEIVRHCGFRLNPSKTRSQPNTARQVVTGVVVNQHLNLPRPEYDLLKATIHHLGSRNDPRRNDARFVGHLEGRIAWLEQINPVKGSRLRNRLADTLKRSE
ncbi:MAG: reverse transcriptase family protein [Roseovarius sp.]|nr:reverse transcriptase family protein [Roseovarius sp.]